MKLDPLCSERALEQIRELEIKAECDARQKFQHRHFATEAVPNRAKLKANRARADDEKFLWRRCETESFSTADDDVAIKFRERQFDRHATRGNDDVFGFDFVFLAARRFH